VAFEFGWAHWKMAFSNGPRQKVRRCSITDRDLFAIHDEIRRAKQKFRMDTDTAVCSCHKAARDEFWLHRCLTGDVRQRQRELTERREERNSHLNRIKRILATQGVNVKVDQQLGDRLGALTQRNADPLPGRLVERIRRELEKITRVDRQIRTIAEERQDH
jgi:hypothetical protein